LDNVALLVGGTKDVSSGAAQGFYSGAKANDSTGIGGGLLGVYSRPPNTISAWPVGILIPNDGSLEVKSQNDEQDVDFIELCIFGQRDDLAGSIATFNVYRDTVPAIFRTHWTLRGYAGATVLNPAVGSCWVSRYRFGPMTWQTTQYPGCKFTIRLWRPMTVTFTE
jgi:hypothetical protein